MKIVSKDISVIAVFHPGKQPIPYRFKLENKEIQVDEILGTERVSFGNSSSIIYYCESNFPPDSSSESSYAKRYELKYHIGDCRWTMYKI